MRKPNILIFMTDHQRGDTVLPENPTQTPNLDRFARDGVAFANAFCPAPHCCPCRATFFSGLYPSRSGVWNNNDNRQRLSYGLNDGVRLWSEDLFDLGYNLAFSGKWHVSVKTGPQTHRFDTILSYCDRAEDCDIPWSYYRRLAEHPESAERGEGQIIRPGYGNYTLYGVLPDDARRGDDNVVQKAIDALPGLAKGNRPWVLYVGVSAPHDPYFAAKRFVDLYKPEDVELPPSYRDEMNDKPGVYRRLRRQIWGQLSEREVKEGVRHFRAVCSYLDSLFGDVLDALDKTGQSEDTLVLYCSDHGDYCGDHGLFCKGIPSFRGAYHVPAIIRWPGGIKAPGRRIEEFVSLADFAPTFIEAGGGSVNRDFTGSSLAPFLTDGRPERWRDEIHSQCNGVELFYSQRSVMTKDFKYVFNGFDFDEMYDLRNDPHELVNVSDRPEYAEAKRDLVRRMWKFAYRENDAQMNRYITVGLAPYGPSEAFSD